MTETLIQEGLHDDRLPEIRMLKEIPLAKIKELEDLAERILKQLREVRVRMEYAKLNEIATQVVLAERQLNALDAWTDKLMRDFKIYVSAGDARKVLRHRKRNSGNQPD